MRALHRVRESLIRDKVKTTNQIHGFLLEFGISLPIGEAVIKRLSLILAEHGIPEYLSRLLMKLHSHYLYLVEQITTLESELNQSIKADDTAQRIMTIPGVGPITASLLSSQLGDGKQFSWQQGFCGFHRTCSPTIQHWWQIHAAGYQQTRRQKPALITCSVCPLVHDAAGAPAGTR